MSRKLLIFFLFFLGLRILLFNVNISEWGDSYHIVRAAESLRSNFSYPPDEKRLPLFSALIALNPLPVEMMVWAKILQVLLTAGILFLTYRLAKRLLPNLSKNCSLFIVHCLLFSPVFLYWSIRVVGEVLLTFLVLLAFEIYYEGAPGARSYRGRWAAGLGAVCGLAALTRYEGFLLFGAFALPLLFRKKFKPLILYFSFFIFTISPWLIRNYLTFGNPLHSTYFSEPSTYTYNLKTVFIFLASLIFLFGFPPAFSFVVVGLANFFRKFKGESCPERSFELAEKRSRGAAPLFIFIFLELLLILCWPAAVPRLFLPLIPIFTIFAVGSIFSVETHGHASLRICLASVILTALYILSQFSLRLHFLVLSKSGLVLVAGLGLLSALSWLLLDFERAKKIFLGLFLTSQMISSFAVINNHRLIYSDALQAAQFASHLNGLVGYSDETGVVEYYLGEKGRKLPDEFFDPWQQWEWLRENKVDYILVTDEYEQKSRFNVFESADYVGDFELVRSWEVEAADAFDSFLMWQGIFPQRDYPVKSSQVFEVL